MQCLDDRETQMGEDTIFVRFGQRVLQVGNKKTVMMFYSDYQNEKKKRKEPLRPKFHSSSYYALQLMSSYL